MSTDNLDPKTVFVRNLNYQTTEESLTQAFEKFGKVSSCKILKDRFYGKLVSSGKGFVEFAEPESVEKAVSEKEFTVDGRQLNITQARKKYERKNDTAYISGIPQGTTRDDILNEFKNYNAVDAKVVFEDANGYRGGYAFVKFDSTENRDKAVQEKAKFQLKEQESTLSAARRDFDESK